MLTYVINTSDNKTFDSRMLFELAGYSKIRWLHCPLNEIKDVATQICEKQNVVGAERFRVAVIIDFYRFDKIRKPYGRDSFREGDQIDLSLYIPYLEVFLLDNMVAKFEESNLFAEDVEIFYVQNEKSDRYDLFKNAKRQLQDSEVLTGVVETAKPIRELEGGADAIPAPLCDGNDALPVPPEETDAPAATEDPEIPAAPKPKKAKKAEAKTAGEEAPETKEEDNEPLSYVPEFLGQREDPSWSYSEDEGYVPSENNKTYAYCEFLLYCSKNVTLTFRLKDYPYGKEYMTFSEFREAFRGRQSYISGLRRHFYVVPYGGGEARAALAMLSLSLYLIRMYEREENIPCDGDMDMLYLDPVLLRDVLETAWNKVTVAKGVIKKNNAKLEYYQLEQGGDEIVERLPETPEEIERAKREAMQQERIRLNTEVRKNDLRVEQYYSKIVDMADPGTRYLEAERQAEFDEIMQTYLRTRDMTKEADVKAEFEESKRGGFLTMTDQCPSREEYNALVDKKKKNISALFEKALRAEYIEVDYTEEKEEANRVYVAYRRAKSCMSRNIIGDIFFFLLSLAAVLAPYWFLQLNLASSQQITSTVLLMQNVGLFGGLFLAAMALRYIPLVRALKRAHREIRKCYVECMTKRNYSFSAIRARYEKDLVAIEHARYDLRQMKYLYDANLEKERLITSHREMLERLEDCLGGILNNLDVEPVPDPLVSVEEELNLERPVSAKENRIYQVFSVETIERMLPMKGSDCK